MCTYVMCSWCVCVCVCVCVCECSHEWCYLNILPPKSITLLNVGRAALERAEGSMAPLGTGWFNAPFRIGAIETAGGGAIETAGDGVIETAGGGVIVTRAVRLHKKSKDPYLKCTKRCVC